MRKTPQSSNWMILCLTAILVLTAIAACAPFAISLQPDTEQKSENLYAYSQTDKSQADVDADKRICKEFAKKSTDYDPDITMKWPHTWKESAKKFFHIETAQQEWNRAWSACMDARKYSIK